MTGLDNPPDDCSAAIPAAPDCGGTSADGAQGKARDWALAVERERPPATLYEEIAQVVDLNLLRSAQAYATRLVGFDDAPEAVGGTWLKILGSFDPPRGTFKSFFFTVLHNECLDMRKRRKREAPSESVTTGADAAPGTAVWESADAAGAEAEFFRRLDDLEDLIIAAIEVLDLSPRDRHVLSRLVAGATAEPPADPKAAAAERKRKQRALDRLLKQAGLSEDELRAVALVRVHHSVAAAAAAARDLDVRGLYAAAKRKVSSLIGIRAEDGE